MSQINDVHAQRKRQFLLEDVILALEESAEIEKKLRHQP
jgi:hypothetical protein